MRILELFCGIGSVTAAVGDSHSVVGAIDINEHALEVYRANFQDVTLQKEITSLSDSVLRGFDAELWWMSPPCQPFTRRGLRKDCLLYTSPSPRDRTRSRMPSSA